MAIVKTDFSIGSDYTTNFYNFLNTYCSSYFDSITQNEYTVTCKIGNTNFLVYTHGSGITVTTANGKTATVGSYAYYGISTAHGVMISSHSDPSDGGEGFILTQDDAGNTVAIFSYSGDITRSGERVDLYVYNINSLRKDADTYRTFYRGPNVFYVKNVLCPIMVQDTTTAYYTPNCYLIPFAKDGTTSGEVDMDGTRYYTNGIIALKDS